MKEIIALKGLERSGKTTSIRMAYDMLINRFSSIKIIYVKPYKKDITAVLSINNIVIGIESQGDPNSRLKNSLERFSNEYRCNIILCATRTKGETILIVNNMVGHGYNINWVKKNRSIPLNINIDNKRTASILVDKIVNIFSAV